MFSPFGRKTIAASPISAIACCRAEGFTTARDWITMVQPGREEGAMWKEFREFAMRGNVIDLAVGIVIGAAFGKIVSSLVNDIIMPPLGLILGQVDFSNLFINLSNPMARSPRRRRRERRRSITASSSIR